MTDSTVRHFTKGQTVIVKDDAYGTPRKVVQTRTSTSPWRGDLLVKLEGDSSFCRDYQLMHTDEVTPEMQAAFDKAQAKRDREQKKATAEKDAAAKFEREVLEMFADKLRAEPEQVGPIAYNAHSGSFASGGKVGTVLRFWCQQGRGLDTVVAQREEWVGVEVRHDDRRDPVTHRRAYIWVVSMVGGLNQTQQSARLTAEAITYALNEVIPTLGDARPAWDRD